MLDTIRQNSTLSTLSPAQVQVILALAQGASVTKAARLAGVHRSSVYNWLNDEPNFQAAVDQAAEEYSLTLRDALSDLAVSALSVVQSLLENPATTDWVRLRAALAVLGRPRYPHQPWALSASGEDRPEDRKIDLYWRTGDPDNPYIKATDAAVAAPSAKAASL